MTRNPSAEQLHELLPRLLDGSISAADHARLQSLLKDDPQAQRLYLAEIDLDLGLRMLAQEEPDQTRCRTWNRSRRARP
jgi:anti-sigma factor RsiW